MIQTLVLAIPLAGLWLILSRQFTLPALMVGYVFGVAVVVLLRVNSGFEGDQKPLHLRRLPWQLVAAVRYALSLVLEIFIASVDVALRSLAPTITVTPAIYRIPTQDVTNSPLVSALSAHGITITPGTLVIDYEIENGETIMIVHSLDSRLWDEQSQIDGQTARVRDIQRILGNE